MLLTAALRRPLKRVRSKSWLGFDLVDAEPDWHKKVCLAAHEESLAASTALVPPVSFLAEELLEQEPTSASRQVYLVTLPALRRLHEADRKPGLRCPSEWEHESVARIFVDAFENPALASNNASWGFTAQLERFVVFRERHAAREGEVAGPFHWHIALKASINFRFASIKRALYVRHGIASHWSCSHTGYWSAVRYGCMPTPSKPSKALDPTPYKWARCGEHPPLFEVCQEPTTAAALNRRREAKVKLAEESGRPEPRPTEMDLYPVIVQNGFRNSSDDHTAAEKLVQWLKAHGSPALVTFAFKNRQKLSAIIDDVWSWETVDDFLQHNALTRMQLMQKARASPCQCNGQWHQVAWQALQRNSVDVHDLCSHVLWSLQEGRREDVPVLVLMGRFGGEGKSFFLAPLRNVMGLENVQATPQPGSFPLLGLERRKVVLLDEWAFDTSVLPLCTQLLWYEGKSFPLTRPQNKDYSGHLLYTGSAPIFATCKEKELAPIMQKAQEATQLGQPSEWTMLLRRLKIFRFSVPLQDPRCKIPECPACFANLIMANA